MWMLQSQEWLSPAAAQTLQLHTTCEKKEMQPLQLSLPR